MASYLILGAGKFGRLALRRLLAQDPEARIHLVDQRAEALTGLRDLGGAVKATRAEAGEFLETHLDHNDPWDWIVPMVPRHLAYAWLRSKALKAPEWEPVPVPSELETLTDLAIRGPEGELYLSRARHLCPDDCSEPEVCPVDGTTREPPLYRQLAEFPFSGGEMVVVASLPLAPGVGGYAPVCLRQILKRAGRLPDLVLVATACRCHGVVHGLRRREMKKR
jgi:hypothetical protein|uniref:Potassium transporter n=1 Tax=Desulfobacca acetoxidans TaxID=60893 RepID=A0A7C5AKK6_9BACT